MVFHPLVEHVRAHLALDELEGAGAHHLLAVQLFASGIPAGFALDHQVGIGRNRLHELRRRLFEAEHHLVVDHLHALRHFPGHLLDSIRLLYPHQGAPGVGVTLNGLRLRDEENRVAHISGGELSPFLCIDTMNWLRVLSIVRTS